MSRQFPLSFRSRMLRVWIPWILYRIAAGRAISWQFCSIRFHIHLTRLHPRLNTRLNTLEFHHNHSSLNRVPLLEDREASQGYSLLPFFSPSHVRVLHSQNDLVSLLPMFSHPRAPLYFNHSRLHNLPRLSLRLSLRQFPHSHIFYIYHSNLHNPPHLFPDPLLPRLSRADDARI
jgi:hypothetical protein